MTFAGALCLLEWMFPETRNGWLQNQVAPTGLSLLRNSGRGPPKWRGFTSNFPASPFPKIGLNAENPPPSLLPSTLFDRPPTLLQVYCNEGHGASPTRQGGPTPSSI